MKSERESTKLGRGIAATVISVTLIVCVGKLMGFVREILLADGFGASGVVDSFLMAESIATIFLGWLTSFSVIFTPTYIEIKDGLGRKQGDEYTSTLLVFIQILCLCAIVICSALHEPLIRLSAPGFSPEATALTARFLRIVLCSHFFSVSTGLLCVYLNCNDMKVASSASILVFGFLQLFGVFLAQHLQAPMFLAWGLLIAAAAQLVFVLALVNKNKFSFHLSKMFGAQLKRAITLTIPIFISNMIAEINIFVDKLFASYLPEGTVSVLHYASRIRILFSYIFSTILMAVFYPDLSQLAANGDKEKFRSYVSTSLSWVLFLFLPLTAGCLALSKPLISLVYSHGAFSAEALQKTIPVFAIYSVSLTPLAVRDLMIRTLYSYKVTKYSAYVGFATVLSNILLNTIFIKTLQQNGLALATSISAFISVMLYYIAIKKELGSVIDRKVWGTSLKALAASVLMGGLVFFANRLLNTLIPESGKLIIVAELLLLTIVGVTVYALICRLMKVELLSDLIKIVTHRKKTS